MHVSKYLIWWVKFFWEQLRPNLVSKNFCLQPSHQMFGHIHRVLNVDEKKLIHSSRRNHETNLLSLISPWKALSVIVPTYANDGLISIIRFVLQSSNRFCNLFFISIKNPSRHIQRDKKNFFSWTEHSLYTLRFCRLCLEPWRSWHRVAGLLYRTQPSAIPPSRSVPWPWLKPACSPPDD
jgi:hypothetical protein